MATKEQTTPVELQTTPVELQTTPVELQTTPVELLNDYWVTADDRRKAGETVDVPIAEAMKLLEAGKAKRADPIGG